MKIWRKKFQIKIENGKNGKYGKYGKLIKLKIDKNEKLKMS